MDPKRILLVFVAAVLPLVMSAQQSKTDETVEFRPHWSLQLQVGSAYTLGETSFSMLTTSSFRRLGCALESADGRAKAAK